MINFTTKFKYKIQIPRVVKYIVQFFLYQLLMSKFPQRPGCTTLKPFVSGHSIVKSP
jgi:hypothetical protein